MTFAERVLYKVASKGISKARKENKMNSFLKDIIENEVNGMSIAWLLDNNLITEEEATNAMK